MSWRPPDWQLPSGVDRNLWDYVENKELARSYDDSLAGSALVELDLRFAEKHFPVPGRLVDLGCGTGRLLLRFAERGFWVLGVDLSEEMLRIVGEKAAAAGVTVHRVRGNLVELHAVVEESFHYAACLFSTLGMVMGAKERRKVMANAYRLLRPGGKLILHVHNRWFNFWDRGGRRWLFENLLKSVLGRQVAGDRTMPPHQGLAGLTLHLFTRHEAIRLLRETGFQVLEVCPVGLRRDGRFPCPWWFGWLRAYGYLVAAERPPGRGS